MCISIDRNQVGANDNVQKEFLGRRMGLDGPETTNEVCDWLYIYLSFFLRTNDRIKEILVAVLHGFGLLNRYDST